MHLKLHRLPTRTMQHQDHLYPRYEHKPHVRLQLRNQQLRRFRRPLRQIPLLPRRPRQQHLFLRSNILRPTSPTNTTNKPYHRNQTSPRYRRPSMLFPLQSSTRNNLSFPTSRHNTNPTKLIQARLQIYSSSASTKFPIQRTKTNTIQPRLSNRYHRRPHPPIMSLLYNKLLLHLHTTTRHKLYTINRKQQGGHHPYSGRGPHPLQPYIHHNSNRPTLTSNIPRPHLRLHEPLLLLWQQQSNPQNILSRQPSKPIRRSPRNTKSHLYNRTRDTLPTLSHQI